MMTKIHNHPKLEEPRMPVILPTELEDKWLHSISDELDIKAIKELIREYKEGSFCKTKGARTGRSRQRGDKRKRTFQL